MLKVGIDTLGMYTPRYSLDLKILAKARQINLEKYEIGLGQLKMSVPSPGEDIVTMAANAASIALKNVDVNHIEMLLFATESGIDQSKSAGLFVHELLQLPARCRVVELKQACYGGTMALQLALPFLRENPDKKILVIASDIARYGLETNAESSQGAGAIAFVLSANPRMIAIEPAYSVVTESVMDFWRPNYLDEALVDGKYSSKLYLTLLEKTWQQYQLLSQRKFSDHDYFCYHTPVPRLVEKAHHYLLKINQIEPNAVTDQQFLSSLIYSRQIGNSYTASLYIALLSLLDHSDQDLAGKRIGFYSYGSGCVAEFFSGVIEKNYQDMLQTNVHEHLISARCPITYDEYVQFYTFAYPKDGTTVNMPLYDTGEFRLAAFQKHKRIYERVINKEIVCDDELSDMSVV